MSLLLYGIVTENALPADFDVSLLLIHADGLTAVTACCEQADQDVESVLAFGNVVERIHQRTTIIPIRYGSLLPDEAAVVELMAEKASHYRRLLADLEGCEEMGIRLPMAAPEPEPFAAKKPSSGYEYLLAKTEIFGGRTGGKGGRRVGSRPDGAIPQALRRSGLVCWEAHVLGQLSGV